MNTFKKRLMIIATLLYLSLINMDTKTVSNILGTTIRHSARLAHIVGTKLENLSFNWSEDNIKEAKKLLSKRSTGKGRFTKGQER